MYNKIKEDITQDYYVDHFPNDGQRFVAWYLRNIHSLNLNETKYSVTDGPDDKQIDAIYINEENSTVYIIQGKFIGSNSVDSEPLREVLSSWVQLKDLIRLQETGNGKLKQRLADLALALEDDYDIVFELVATGEMTQAASEQLIVFQKELAESEDLSASLNFVDTNELKVRYDLALERERPLLKHTLQLETGKYINMKIAETNVVLAAVPLKDCLDFPGIKDGTLFKKNVRQSLGISNRVNKQIRHTIYSDRHRDFFFYHNGITAICNRMEFDSESGSVNLTGINVVNGCQSLTTILSCSERVKQFDGSYIMFRFYEIPQRERADKISIFTNTQSTVKPRDLRSNDKRVLALKKAFEQCFSQGYFITKRGEEPPAEKDKRYVIDLSDLGKYLIAWHSQRPNISYSETRIFDKYFEQLFKRDYTPDNIQALNCWMGEINKGWVAENPYFFNESLLAMKSYAPYHHLYAVSMCFSIASNMRDRVPVPAKTYQIALENNKVSDIVKMAATCLNFALETAANEPQPANRVFSPQNWIKTKSCLGGISAAISMQLMMLQNIPGGPEIKQALMLPSDSFEYRWAAD